MARTPSNEVHEFYGYNLLSTLHYVQALHTLGLGVDLCVKTTKSALFIAVQRIFT